MEVVLFGVSFPGSRANYEEKHLLPEPLFAVPTDGNYVVTIKSTPDGRIFMGTKNVCMCVCIAFVSRTFTKIRSNDGKEYYDLHYLQNEGNAKENR